MRKYEQHGHRNHPFYKIWTDIKTRCYNSRYKQYKDYGGRGIIMCDEWKNSAKVFQETFFKILDCEFFHKRINYVCQHINILR